MVHVFPYSAMRYRFVVNGIGIRPKHDFDSLWQAFMWIYGSVGEHGIDKVKIEKIKNG